MEIAYINSFTDRHGRERYYFRKGGKRIAMPSPTDQKFTEAYDELLAKHAPHMTTRKGRAAIRLGTLDWVIQQYKDHSPDWAKTKDSTRAIYNRRFDLLRAQCGGSALASFNEKGLRAIRGEFRETPSVADALVDMIGRLWRFAKEHIPEMEDLGPNPATEVASIHTRHESHKKWPPELVALLEAHPNPRVRRAYFLIRYTGQRRSDIVKMRDIHFDGTAIEVVQQKTGTYVWVPAHKALREHLIATGIHGGYLLLNSHRRPYARSSLGNLLCATCAELGFPGYGPHGGRHLAGAALAEAGCTIEEIMSILGHQTEKEARTYVKQASRKVMAKAGMAKLEASS